MSGPADRHAHTEVPIHPLLAGRWSPRAYDPDHELTDAQVTALLEAARWAPSWGNSQPWRVALARRGTPAHQAIAGTLARGNAHWAPAASALMLIAAETVDDDGDERPTAAYDTGQAIGHLVVQAQAEGLFVRQMGGFDHDAAAALIDDPSITPIAVAAIGRRLEGDDVPERLAERERAPRSRQPVEAMLLELDAASASSG